MKRKRALYTTSFYTCSRRSVMFLNPEQFNAFGDVAPNVEMPTVIGPLEQMADSLQQLFERGSVPNDLVRIIESGADGVWKQVEQVVRAP